MKLLVDPAVYSDEVLERFENPPGAGWLENPERAGCAASAVRNSEICFALHIEDGRVARARFRARGCPHTIALASLAVEALQGVSVTDLAAFDATGLAERLALPPGKLDLKILVEDAVRGTAAA